MVATLSDAGRIARDTWKNYLLRRYLRLYVTFIPVFLVYLLAARDEVTPISLIKSLFFIPEQDNLPLMCPTWILATFLVFYWLLGLSILFHREASLIPIFETRGKSHRREFP